ncbi:TetR/AcrR family transcriptional regulator [Phytoactinopolyspora halotolerans]|uniref:TetR family transcriptional regulator n=1 Tax=Phytoactinopolyspora halotolerans TaxID=1981512 RepID=A0A6L9SB44_9ACTN|nr:TetR family transcriptional regulator [Phytoactinopolyspora halotolerans]NEE01220.1 TetR family transcriptional regulator [Phytoactinopolyspora halotolerans]
MPNHTAQPEQGSVTDGRRARGLRRRAEIIDATLRVVERDGTAGVTHRTVAKEAGVPTSLSTYYFATLDDLLVAALSSVSDQYTAQLRKIIEADGDEVLALARLIVESASGGRKRALAERELSTLAARRPALRPVAIRWRETVAELARHHTSDARAVQAFVAAADGMCTAILLDDAEPDVATVEAVLRGALRISPESANRQRDDTEPSSRRQ